MIFNNLHFRHFFYFVFLLISQHICHSQQNNLYKQGIIYQLINNKVDSILENDFLLMNARYYIVKNPRARGNPYFEANNLTYGTLFLNKKEYNNIQLSYDICDQKLIFTVEKNWNKGVNLELNNCSVTRFYLDKRIFVNCSELSLFPQSGFYEEIFSGKYLKVYARWGKHFNNTANNDYLGEYTSQKKKLLFEINGKKVDELSKHGFLKVFSGERKKIKSFIRKNQIRLTKSNNNDLKKLFKYADSLLE